MKLDFSPEEWALFYKKIDFTDEEKAIIQFRRRGWKLSTIAAELYLSERTVNRRICNVAKKILKVI